MNIPDKVKIGFKDYKVNKVDREVTEGNTVCYGVIHFDDGFIDISKKCSKDIQECALIHECVHGIDDIFGIDLSEEQIEKLGKGIYGFIKDNPEVFLKPSNEISADFNMDSKVKVDNLVNIDDLVDTVINNLFQKLKMHLLL